MRRKLLIALLAVGTVGGFAGGFASMCWRAKHRHHHFKQQVTEVCADAMRQAQRD